MAYGTIAAETIQSGTAGTPPNFKDLNGTEQGQLCRAWVNFNGTGTVAIRASFNVSSITDNGVGDYTINFTNAMPDANYSAVGGIRREGVADTNGIVVFGWLNETPTTSAIKARTGGPAQGSSIDFAYVFAAIFR